MPWKSEPTPPAEPRQAARERAERIARMLDGPTDAVLQEPGGPDRPQRPPKPPTPPQPPTPPADADATTMLPAVDDSQGPDLSESTTRRRASSESRGQVTPPASESAPEAAPAQPSEPATPKRPGSPTPAAASASPPSNTPRSDATPSDAPAPKAADKTPDTPQRDEPHKDEPKDETRKGDRRTSPTRIAAASAGATPRRRAAPKSSGGRATLHNATVAGRILIAISCVLALVGTGFVWSYLSVKNDGWRTVDALSGDTGVRDGDKQAGNQTYLIVGTDTRSGKNSNVGAGSTADADGARSDTVILVNIPSDRSRVVAVSFPRDLQVDRPQCQEWDNGKGEYKDQTLQLQSNAKLNSVYGDGGPKCLVDVVQKLSGVDVNHFIAMDFYGFEQVVNKIGGVKVCSATPLYDYELGQILRKGGTTTLKGKSALNYVRARKVASEGNGDYGRIKRQQLFLSSLLRGSLSSQTLSNPGKLNGIINTFIDNSFVDNVNTDSLLQLGESMQGVSAGRVTFVTLPTSGTSTDGQYNEIPRMSSIKPIFDAIINNDPLPGEQKKASSGDKPSGSSTSSSAKQPTPAPATGPATDTTATAVSATSVGIRILNGTGRSKQATPIYEKLSANGYDVRGVADASVNRADTVVRYGAGAKNQAATVAKMFPGAKIQQDATVKEGVEVILGSDFTNDSLGTPPSSGSAIEVSQYPPARNEGLPNDLAVTNAGSDTCE